MSIARKTAARLRTVEACLKCRARKAKCSDTRPCARCMRFNEEFCKDIDVGGQSLTIIRNMLASPSVDFKRTPSLPGFKITLPCSSGINVSTDLFQTGRNATAMTVRQVCETSF